MRIKLRYLATIIICSVIFGVHLPTLYAKARYKTALVVSEWATPIVMGNIKLAVQTEGQKGEANKEVNMVAAPPRLDLANLQ